MISKRTILLLALLTSISLTYSWNPEHLSQFERTGQCPSCDLSGADMREPVNNLVTREKFINLKGTNLSGCNFDDTTIVPPHEKGDGRGPLAIRVNMSGTNLTNASFIGARLYNVDLSASNLTHTNFHNARLTEVLLTKSNLTNTHFPYAHLYACSLRAVTGLNTVHTLKDSQTKYCDFSGTWRGVKNDVKYISRCTALVGVTALVMTSILNGK